MTRTWASTNNGGSGGSFQLPVSGAINGVNQTYVWATAPNVICSDGNSMIKVDQTPTTPGDVNWTGTTTTVMTVPPNNSIYSPS